MVGQQALLILLRAYASRLARLCIPVTLAVRVAVLSVSSFLIFLPCHVLSQHKSNILFQGARGGQGGGIINITAQSLTLNAWLSSDGVNNSYTAGGSGGSICILTGLLIGSGKLSANGGQGGSAGGSGSGGRIALYYNTSSFNGPLESFGGGGAFQGGPGTVFTQNVATGHKLLLISNNNDSKTITNLYQITSMQTSNGNFAWLTETYLSVVIDEVQLVKNGSLAFNTTALANQTVSFS